MQRVGVCEERLPGGFWTVRERASFQTEDGLLSCAERLVWSDSRMGTYYVLGNDIVLFLSFGALGELVLL